MGDGTSLESTEHVWHGTQWSWNRTSYNACQRTTKCDCNDRCKYARGSRIESYVVYGPELLPRAASQLTDLSFNARLPASDTFAHVAIRYLVSLLLLGRRQARTTTRSMMYAEMNSERPFSLYLGSARLYCLSFSASLESNRSVFNSSLGARVSSYFMVS